MHRRKCLALLIAALATGCTNVNVRLNPDTTPTESRQANHTRAALGGNITIDVQSVQHTSDPGIRPATRPTASPIVADTDKDSFFVGIAISGGGSRSANFAAACMFQLEQLGLLERADYISSVSGGSLAAAYYCISTDDEWNPGNVQRKLTHSFASDMIWGTIVPWNLVVMLMSDWDRSDVLADSFQKTLFTRDGHGLTFGDLRPERPRLLLNATDLQSGRSFVFCNESFDQLNSDLSKYPLGHAVAASSAVPVLLHQVTLRDYSTVFKQYRHLVDGGVVDNLGVRTLVETYRSQLRASGGTAYRRGAVFIVIDATTSYDARISSRGDTSLLETLQLGGSLSSTVLLNRASSATLAEIILDSAPDNVPAAQLRRERDQLMNDGYVRLENVQGRPVLVLHLALSRVHDIANLPFKGFTESINSIATYFNIDPTEAYHLYQAAELLTHERFAKPLREIADELNGPTTRP